MDENRLNRLEGKIDSIQNGVSHGIAALTSSVTGIEKDVKHMGNNFGAIKSDVDKTRDEVNKIKSDMNSLHTAVKVIWIALTLSGGGLFWLLRETGILARILRYTQ